jgi:hypothetical protein
VKLGLHSSGVLTLSITLCDATSCFNAVSSDKLMIYHHKIEQPARVYIKVSKQGEGLYQKSEDPSRTFWELSQVN